MTERYFEYDTASIDASKVETRDDKIHGHITIFKDVVISREIIHAYTDGVAYKPAEELKDAAWTAEGMWAIAGGHPKDAVIMDRDEIQGRTVNARFSKSLIDPKTKRPNNKGIVADLEIFDNKVAPEVLADMKAGKRHDVSIGFFFHRDETPGVISEDGHPLKGGVYDYVQRKMTINHTAFALESGRCPMPFCGVGADEIAQHIANDPFAGFKNFAECVKKNQDKDDPEAYCGSIKAKAEKKDIFKTVLENIKGEIDVVLTKFDNVEELKRGEGETIIDESMSDEDLSGLLAFYRITEANWDDFLHETQAILRSLWTEREKYYKDGDPAKMAGGEKPDADPVLQGDSDIVDCPDCEDNEEKVKQIATDLSIEQIDEKLKELKTARERLKEQARKLDEQLYNEPDSEKKRKQKIRDERGEIWDRLDDLYDEIRAYTQAKTVKITQIALADSDEEGGKKPPVEDETVVLVPFKPTKSIEDLLNRQ
jgi:hypothetical protein